MRKTRLTTTATTLYYVTIEVTDGEFDDQLHVTVIVTGQNEVPEVLWSHNIEGHLRRTPAKTKVLAHLSSATDPERDELTYSLSGTDASHFDYRYVNRPDTDEVRVGL